MNFRNSPKMECVNSENKNEGQNEHGNVEDFNEH